LLVVDELNHRVRNTLMVVQGMASDLQGQRCRVALDAFNARLHALAAAARCRRPTGSAPNCRSGAARAGDLRHRSRPARNIRPSAAVALVLVLQNW
jgi:hypothetical protein